jgi:hypothetical protein
VNLHVGSDITGGSEGDIDTIVSTVPSESADLGKSLSRVFLLILRRSADRRYRIIFQLTASE